MRTLSYVHRDVEDTLPAPVTASAGRTVRLAAPRTPTGRARLGAGERFTCVASLGEGGEGEVWRARDRDLDRDVAIKRPHGASSHQLVAEGRVAGALEHPGIVPVHDVGVDEAGQPYLVMRYVDGTSLAQIVELLARGDHEAHALHCFERRMTIFRKVCEAVAYAHARGVVHGDIKPANILVGRFGEVFLTDWGVARRIGDGASGTVSGTPAYMSPEQARGAAVDARSDVFSLCATLYELLTLKPWIDGTSALDVLARLPHARALHPTDVSSPHQPRVPMDLGWFVLGGLAADPAKRYASVEAMIARLDRRAEGLVPIQCSQTALKRGLSEAVRLLERRPHLLPAAVAMLVVGYAVATLSPLLR